MQAPVLFLKGAQVQSAVAVPMACECADMLLTENVSAMTLSFREPVLQWVIYPIMLLTPHSIVCFLKELVCCSHLAHGHNAADVKDELKGSTSFKLLQA